MGATDPTAAEPAATKDVEVKPAAATTEPAEAVEDVPDPDEDDLDDLDDMLDDFASAKIDDSKAAKPAQPAESSTKPEPAAKQATVGEESEISEEDFAKQLQAGMAELLGEMDQSPEMQKEFENMLKQFSGAADAEGAEGASKSASGAAPAADASFQDTIRKTMERMQNSGEQATAAAASGGADDFMSELLKQMSSGDFGGGEGSEDDFSKMLMGMMEQLTTKEILYEPMKDLNEKFPEWMEKNKASTPADDLKRYEEQQSIVKEIVERFEKSTYADTNSEDREYIIERMQKMQDAGSPPADLVGDMPSAQEAFNAPDEQCNPQ